MARRSAAALAETERADEQAMLQEYIRNASASRESRRATAANLRQWYESGTQDGYPARYNKLRSHLDKLASYLWSPDQVRFGVHLPPTTRQDWLAAATIARDEFRQAWSVSSGADLVISLALEWALVYGAMPLKVSEHPEGFRLDAIDPWDFGVTREDQALDDQDVLVHWYTLSMAQVERWAQGHRREAELIQLANDRKRTPSGGVGMTRLIITGLTGSFPNQSVTGSMPGDNADEAVYNMDPQVTEPTVTFCDVWARRLYVDGRDRFEDWRVWTCFAEGGSPDVLVRRRNPVLPWVKSASGAILPGEHPFTLLTPRPLPNYLWGRSELASLLALQEWRERHIKQMDDLLQRQLDPSKFFSGTGDWEEANRAMKSPGGAYGAADAGVKMQTIEVKLEQEAFLILGQIDQMFSDQAGMPQVLQGEQPPNVRAQNQLVALAGIGAGRVRHMALQLESTLSEAATLGFRVLQRGDPQTYTTPQGERFLLAQLPPGLTLRVLAHSASPIFSEQTQEKALALFKAGSIDAEDLVELMDPPYREELKDKARKLMQSRSQQQERMLELALARVQRRAGRMGPG